MSASTSSAFLPKSPEILIFGAGAVGSTIAGWLAPQGLSISVFDTAATCQIFEQHGLTLFEKDQAPTAPAVKLRTYSDLTQVPRPDLILLCVKTYSLAKVSELLVARFGKEVPVVGFQNGIENQAILSRYFTRPFFGIVSYNCWIDRPGKVGYQKKGPLVLGVKDSALQPLCRQIAELLNRGVPTEVTDRLDDAVYSKMVVNLTNSLTTLIGHGLRPVSDQAIFQKLLSNLTYEGVRIVQASGHQECRLGGMPSWLLMRAAARLPQFLTRRAFQKNVRKMVISSMAQDILQRGGSETELDALNGHFLELARKHHLSVPYNETVYRLCKERFGKPSFQPMDVQDVWTAVHSSTSTPDSGADQTRT
jgi:2-dehydropantoate 2-reductase